MGMSMDNKKRTEEREKTNPTTAPDIQLYTLSELEPILQVTHRTLQNYVKTGRLKAVMIGGKWKVSGENLKKFVNGD